MAVALLDRTAMLLSFDRRRPFDSTFSTGTVGVFGATCPLGRRLIDVLLSHGCAVHAAARSLSKLPPAWLSHRAFSARECDALHPHAPANALGDASTVIWLVHIAASSQADEIQLNARAFEDVCQSPRVARVILVSSGGAVYGNTDRFPIDEAHPRRPISGYGRAKFTMENLLMRRGQMLGRSGIVIRPGNIYGAEYLRAGARGVVGAFARGIATGTPLVIRGVGRATRDYVHLDDVVRAICSAVEWPGASAVWNVGTGVETESRAVLELLCGIMHQRPRTVHHRPAAPGDVDRNVLDVGRIEQDCGWKPSYSLEEGLRLMMEGAVARRELSFADPVTPGLPAFRPTGMQSHAT